MFICRLEKEGNISFTKYEHGKGNNRAEEVILLKKFSVCVCVCFITHVTSVISQCSGILKTRKHCLVTKDSIYKKYIR
jgi:hypothetical protein